MLILCVICTCVVGCATSDDMTTSDVPDEELTIFRCGDYYYNVDGWTDVMNFSSSNIDIPDGGCARIVADVTYMWGGVAGFNKDVGVNEIKEARLIDYEEAFPEGDSRTLDSEDRKNCWICLKNLMRDEGTSDLFFLGQLNRENVCSVLDLYDYDDDIRNIGGAILLYRDIEENDNEFVYTSYIASGPGRGDIEGAVIYRNVYHVDKASHKINIDKDCIKDIFY